MTVVATRLCVLRLLRLTSLPEEISA